MHGNKQREKKNMLKLIDARLRTLSYLELTGLDMVPLELNESTLLQYLANSGYIEALVLKNIKDLNLYDEVLNEIYLMIYEKRDRLLDIYEHEFLGAMTSYIQMLVTIQVRCTNSQLYKRIGCKNKEILVDDFTQLQNYEYDE